MYQSEVDFILTGHSEESADYTEHWVFGEQGIECIRMVHDGKIGTRAVRMDITPYRSIDSVEKFVYSKGIVKMPAIRLKFERSKMTKELYFFELSEVDQNLATHTKSYWGKAEGLAFQDYVYKRVLNKTNL